VKGAVNFIVYYCPEVIVYLYGSMARGELKPDSDADILVIRPELNFDEIYLVQSLSKEGLGWPDGVDVNYLRLANRNDAHFFKKITDRNEAALLYRDGNLSFPWEK
ncbi:nucleotidyltransferase domain-containing protein, partial [Patescibacteria group bacterium]|nr:nucleotidyltransferase domain-containing protein [Patescibacteria group bacterium]